MERRILEELVYGRVRRTVNLCQLVIIEQELEENIQRALAPGEEAAPGEGAEPREDAGASEGREVGGGAGASVPGREPGELAREYVQRAWERLGREWSALREDLARVECARCVQDAGWAGGECDAP